MIRIMHYRLCECVCSGGKRKGEIDERRSGWKDGMR